MLRRSFVTHVSLAHRYHNPRWDESRNRRAYGEEHNHDGIGANMRVWLEVEGEPAEGIFQPFGLYVKELLDHRCLFDAEPWFETRISTLENIAVFVAEKIAKRLPPAGRWSAVTIESADWSARVPVGSAENMIRLTHRLIRDEWTVEAGIDARVDLESGLAAIRSEMAAHILSTPMRDPHTFYQDLSRRLPNLACLRCRKARDYAVEFVAF